MIYPVSILFRPILSLPKRAKGDGEPGDSVSPTIWSSAEPCVGLVCACLPCLRPLFIKLIPGFTSRSGNRSYPNKSAERRKGAILAAARKEAYDGGGGGAGGKAMPLRDLVSKGRVNGEFQRLSDPSEKEKGRGKVDVSAV